MRTRTVLVVLATLACLTAVAAPAVAGPVTGSAGIGDPYFPLAGNGGYDVRHYHVAVRYDPATNALQGVTRITLVPTDDLSRFDLDLVGLTVDSVSVASAPATFVRRLRQELVITPAHVLRADHAVDVVVAYHGIPNRFRVPGTFIRTGVVPTDDGAIIWGEPQVAAAWYPVNDHPRDKASYRIDLTVPAGLQAVSNGTLASHSTRGGWTTWRWIERAPMASYLALGAIGHFDLRFRTTPSGLRVIDAVDPGIGNRADFALQQEIRIVRFLAQHFGPYPFDALGGVVDDASMGAALENQTRPIYDPGFFRPGGGTPVVVHELAHQWFGDSVSVDLWQYTWLNEGFATYAEWLWSGARGRGTAEQIAANLCSIPSSDPFWSLRIGAPGKSHIFDDPVYERGALTLEALRRRVGSQDFFDILRSWAAAQAGRTGSTAQFQAVAQLLSGSDLAAFFQRWLFTSGRPDHCSAPGASPAAAVPFVPNATHG
ncbi:MAG TPA: M1 family metallopeptidase [Actinomycetota bacterium]|nr:M1 family metallopeptidase [Actinomycetota bacterium]